MVIVRLGLGLVRGCLRTATAGLVACRLVEGDGSVVGGEWDDGSDDGKATVGTAVGTASYDRLVLMSLGLGWVGTAVGLGLLRLGLGAVSSDSADSALRLTGLLRADSSR